MTVSATPVLSPHPMLRRSFGVTAIGIAALVMTPAAQAAGSAAMAVSVRGAAMLLCAALLISGFMAIVGVTLLHHRRQRAQQSNFHRSVVAEMCWALVPCLMVAGLVWPAARGALSL